VAVDPDNDITWRKNTEKTVIDEYNLSIGAIFPGGHHCATGEQLFEQTTHSGAFVVNEGLNLYVMEWVLTGSYDLTHARVRGGTDTCHGHFLSIIFS